MEYLCLSTNSKADHSFHKHASKCWRVEMQWNPFSSCIVPKLACVLCIHLGLSVGRAAMAYHTGVVRPKTSVQEMMVERDLRDSLESKCTCGRRDSEGDPHSSGINLTPLPSFLSFFLFYCDTLKNKKPRWEETGVWDQRTATWEALIQTEAQVSSSDYEGKASIYKKRKGNNSMDRRKHFL